MVKNMLTQFTVEVTAPDTAAVKREFRATVKAADALAAVAMVKHFMVLGDRVRVFNYAQVPGQGEQFVLHVLADVVVAPKFVAPRLELKTVAYVRNHRPELGDVIVV